MGMWAARRLPRSTHCSDSLRCSIRRLSASLGIHPPATNSLIKALSLTFALCSWACLWTPASSHLLVNLLTQTGIEALLRTLVLCRDVLPFALRPVRDVKCGPYLNFSAVGIGRPFWDLDTTTGVARKAEAAWGSLGFSSSDYSLGADADLTIGVSVGLGGVSQTW
jgi:hypothetical protein